jgi:Tol biopolymer transport system component
MKVRSIRWSGLAPAPFLLFLCGSAFAQSIERVSVNSLGRQGNADSTWASLSADGRFVGFTSRATNLVPGDRIVLFDVYVHDRRNGVTELVSTSLRGEPGNGGSAGPKLSADGRFVAFESYATDLVPHDANGEIEDVYLADRALHRVELISVSSAGMQGNQDSEKASISADGRFVAFMSLAVNLVPGDTNHNFDVFVRDRQAGTTERVSVAADGSQVFGESIFPSISADGRFVAFYSTAADLVPGDTNGIGDFFVKDRSTGSIERVNVESGGAQANGDSWSRTASISADGRFVLFDSDASNLVQGDTNGLSDMFVRDRWNGTTERVSIAASGQQANGRSSFGEISADGRFVAFQSFATNLVPPYPGAHPGVYVRDRRSQTTTRASSTPSGGEANGVSADPAISSDGRMVAFDSAATNLVTGDSNSAFDVFAVERDAEPFQSLCNPGSAGTRACPCSNPASGPDRGCDNSAATGGATLSAFGAATLSSDTVFFTTSGETPSAASVLVQSDAFSSAGTTYGQGVRCAGGVARRLFSRDAIGGATMIPDPSAGEPRVSARSASLGDVIAPGEKRWYFVFYRDAVVLGRCPASNTFNTTQARQVIWSL